MICAVLAAARGRPARRRLAAWLGLFALISLPGAHVGARAAGEWYQPFAGAWTGQGRFLDNDSQHRVSIAPAIDGRFVRFSVRYQWTAADGRPAAFAGEALYPADAALALRGAWFDSEGHQYATSAYLETPRALIVHWGDATMRGRSEYRVAPSGELQVTDHYWRDGQWQAFSSGRLGRDAGER